MITYEKLKNKPQIFKSITGLTTMAFSEVLPAFDQAYEDNLDRRDEQREQPRQRQRGGGRKGALRTVEDRLVFILFYLRVYPTQILQGYLFDLGQPQANQWIHRLTPVLNQALGKKNQLPARQAKDIEAVLEACPGLEFINRWDRTPDPSPERPGSSEAKLQRQEKATHGQKQPDCGQKHPEDQRVECHL